MVFLKHFKIELVNRNCMKSVKHKTYLKCTPQSAQPLMRSYRHTQTLYDCCQCVSMELSAWITTLDNHFWNSSKRF